MQVQGATPYFYPLPNLFNHAEKLSDPEIMIYVSVLQNVLACDPLK